MLSGAQKSLEENGRQIELSKVANKDEIKEAFVHPTAIVEAGSEIGSGNRIWHFSHVMPDVVLGQVHNLGQNVFVGKSLKI